VTSITAGDCAQAANGIEIGGGNGGRCFENSNYGGEYISTENAWPWKAGGYDSITFSRPDLLLMIIVEP
jgi:hypothetical protein